MKLPLIFFTLLFFLIVFLRWRANRPKEEKVEKSGEPQRKEKPKSVWGKIATSAIMILIFAGFAVWAYNLISGYMHPKVPATTTSQNWQVCWEKKPEYEGKTPQRYKCLPAKIEKRTNSHIIISYAYTGGEGVQEGSSIDGTSYSGEWKDGTGWGKWHLRFTSSDTAFGWSDDEGRGEKQPNVLEKI